MPTDHSERYPEERLANDFLPWARANWGYVELFEDIDTSGADPVDSAGFIDDETILFELKDSVSGSMICYEGSAGSSIEKKIRTVLGNLYGDADDSVTKSLRGWNRTRSPIFILVANSYSKNALSTLNGMLSDRSRQWHFGYRVLRWTEGAPVTLLSKEPVDEDPGVLSQISFPDMPSTAPRRKKPLSMDYCMRMAKERGLGEVLSTFLLHLEKVGGRRKANTTSIGFAFPRRNNSSRETVIALWPDHCSRNDGILISFHQGRVCKCFPKAVELDLLNELPGKPGPIVGFLNSHRYLLTVKDVQTFWEALTDRQS